MDLRAYIHPPWRAQEWQLTSEWVQIPVGNPPPIPTNPIPIAINGNAAVPNGYRGVVKHARMHAMLVDSYDPRLTPVQDWPSGNKWSLIRNGQVVPGCSRRGVCWKALKLQSLDVSGSLSEFVYQGSGLDFFFDLVVPVQLNQGDTLGVRLDQSDGITQVMLYLAGWIFPVTQDMDSAQGCAADPWGA